MLTITAKKSQMEIIGLVIIVILISLALIFFLQFSMKETSSDKRAYTSAQLASGMINTLAKTTTDCSGKTISELYAECANLNPVDCDRDRFEESDACEKANSTVTMLLDSTLAEWRKKFKFQVFILILRQSYTAQTAELAHAQRLKQKATLFH
jgi:hypothetical protein